MAFHVDFQYFRCIQCCDCVITCTAYNCITINTPVQCNSKTLDALAEGPVFFSISQCGINLYGCQCLSTLTLLTTIYAYSNVIIYDHVLWLSLSPSFPSTVSWRIHYRGIYFSFILYPISSRNSVHASFHCWEGKYEPWVAIQMSRSFERH